MKFITLSDLFDLALENYKRNNKINLEKYSVVDLDDYPRGYDPFFAIELFLNNNGPELWENVNNITYVNEWLKNHPYHLLQHPVTGDTIYHMNPNLILFLNLDPEYNSLKNFDSVTVEYNSLKEINFV